MAQRYSGFKDKLAQALAQNPNLTRSDIDELRKRYRSEYNRLLKLQSSAESKFSTLAKLNTLQEGLPRKTMLSPETRAKLMEGTFEEFFSRADTLRSTEAVADYIREQMEEEESEQDAAFEIATNMASQVLDYPFSEEPYHTNKSNARTKIDQWFKNIVTKEYTDMGKMLPSSILIQVINWKEATLKLIGPENFVDLMENKMGYHVDALHGDVDIETFFSQVYIEDEHRYETRAEASSRISFWIQQASGEAMDYLNEDQDTGDYDEVTQVVVDALDDVTAFGLRTYD